MSTLSITKNFTIEDPEAIDRLCKLFEKPPEPIPFEIKKEMDEINRRSERALKIYLSQQ